MSVHSCMHNYGCFLLYHLGQKELQPVAHLQGHTVAVEEGHLLKYPITAMLLSAKSSFDLQHMLMPFSSPINIPMASNMQVAITVELEELLIALQ